MKRIFSILTAALLLAILIPTAASATTVAEGPCGDNLTWVLDDTGTLTISGQGSMPDFDFEGAPWFAHRANITQVILESGVTNISWNSFDYCYAMTRIQIPDTVTRIDCSFYYCTGLTEVFIPKSVTYLDGFAQCSSLSRLEVDPANPNYSSRDNVLFNKDQTTLITYPMGLSGTYVFPDSVTTISTSAFNSCKNLTGVVLSKAMKSVGFQAFSYCENLASVTIPEGVETIEGRAFYECTALTELKLPESLTRIDDSAFAYCESLTELGIPKNVTVIEGGAFSCCRNLNTIRFEGNAPVCSPSESNRAEEIFFAVTATAFYPADNPVWTEQIMKDYGGTITWIAYNTDDDSILASGTCGDNLIWALDKDGMLTISGSGKMDSYLRNSNAPWYDHRSQIRHVVITEGVSSIGSYAFYEHRSILSVEIPSSLTEIGAGAFEYCVALDGDIVIPDSVTTLGGGVFYKCWNLDGVMLGSGLTTISSGTFSCCITLGDEMIIPNGIQSIGLQAFYECTGLNKIIFGKSLTYIEDMAFYGCKYVTELVFTGTTAPTVNDGNGVFSKMDALHTVWVPAGSLNSYTAALSDKLPAGVVIKEDNTVATGSCGVHLTWTLDTEGTLTISGSGSMSSFEGAYGSYRQPWDDYIDDIVTIDIQDGVTSISNYAFSFPFRNNDKILEVRIPDSVQTLGKNCFAYCNFVDITLPDSITTLPSNIFFGCSNLTDYRIPSNITRVEDHAFQRCGNLKTVTIPENVTWIGAGVFFECSNLESVTFKGDAPKIAVEYVGAIFDRNMTAYYPAGNDTWNSETLLDYNYETTTWIPYGAAEDPEVPEELNWFFDRLKESDSYLWATATYQRIMDTLKN